MSEKIVIRIEGNSDETDAPTVGDLLSQLRDYFDLLGIVEQTIAADGQSAIQWRVVHATKGSPLSFTIQAFSRQYAVNIDNRASLVVGNVSKGLLQLKTDPVRPLYFTDEAVSKAEGIFERVTNGLGRTTIETSVLAPVVITPEVARVGVRNTHAVLTPVSKPYREIGSVEGYFESVNLDGWNRRVLRVKHRLTGEEVKCFVSGEAEREVALCEIGDVWSKRRVSVFGTIHYKSLGRISHVDASRARFLRERADLPDVDDIIDPDFTGGARSEDYLEKLRNGEIS